MSKTESQTHPVYIAKDRKNEVKAESVQLDESMKTVTERCAEHAMEYGLHKVPVGESADLQLLAVMVDKGLVDPDAIHVDEEILPDVES